MEESLVNIGSIEDVFEDYEKSLEKVKTDYESFKCEFTEYKTLSEELTQRIECFRESVCRETSEEYLFKEFPFLRRFEKDML